MLDPALRASTGGGVADAGCVAQEVRAGGPIIKMIAWQKGLARTEAKVALIAIAPRARPLEASLCDVTYARLMCDYRWSQLSYPPLPPSIPVPLNQTDLQLTILGR